MFLVTPGINTCFADVVIMILVNCGGFKLSSSKKLITTLGFEYGKEQDAEEFTYKLLEYMKIECERLEKYYTVKNNVATLRTFTKNKGVPIFNSFGFSTSKHEKYGTSLSFFDFGKTNIAVLTDSKNPPVTVNGLTLRGVVCYNNRHYTCYFHFNGSWWFYTSGKVNKVTIIPNVKGKLFFYF